MLGGLAAGLAAIVAEIFVERLRLDALLGLGTEARRLVDNLIVLSVATPVGARVYREPD